MHARFSDPHGPKAWRGLPYAITLLVLISALFGWPLHGTAAAVTGFGALAAFNLLGVVNRRQRVPRAVDLELGPGYVVVNNAGSRNQRIRAADI
ncbi:MAG TPA: hypothetical protein VM925_13365, partial [Labilithrix sp.]|nr:hypothetical protein [Labilithrix sp.]